MVEKLAEQQFVKPILKLSDKGLEAKLLEDAQAIIRSVLQETRRGARYRNNDHTYAALSYSQLESDGSPLTGLCLVSIIDPNETLEDNLRQLTEVLLAGLQSVPPCN